MKVMACAKHFPGHGDVAVDSHLDLPVITVGSMMVAHLYVPAIDTTRNRAPSLSKNNVTMLYGTSSIFKGITFTDALEMKGVAEFYPQGEASVQSLIAGKDMLCLPGDIQGSIKKIRKAIRHDQLSWSALYRICH